MTTVLRSDIAVSHQVIIRDAEPAAEVAES